MSKSAPVIEPPPAVATAEPVAGEQATDQAEAPAAIADVVAHVAVVPEAAGVDLEALDDLRKIHNELLESMADEAVKKEIYDSAKARTKALKERETAIVGELVNPSSATKESLPLFDGLAAESQIVGDTWKSVGLADLGITSENFNARVIESLLHCDPPLTTLGALAAFTGDGHEFSDLDGIGPETADKLADKLADYWAKNPLTSKKPGLDWAAIKNEPGDADAMVGFEAFSTVEKDEAGNGYAYVVAKTDAGKWTVGFTPEELIATQSDYFDNDVDAKAFCQAVEDGKHKASKVADAA